MTIAAVLAVKGNEVVMVTETMVIKDVINLLNQRRIGAVLVTSDTSDVVGVLSERDIIRGLATHGAELLDMTAKTMMTSPVVTCRPTDSVRQVLMLITERRIRHVPVVEEGRLLESSRSATL
ncbi:CBS domain-containing protein [Pedomonas mirosovicensis]|uniref:CBS domain-containing protein n=1 Tax=Pedomonas mirosovicensis TaxID=2908641 RepID=UPI0021691E25|nr:CBS domain-containing protein [Pedomonas mirosovicensis]MCH8686154.1 CBS domain-containing protein [Pedomonas mirosovicensis]